MNSVISKVSRLSAVLGVLGALIASPVLHSTMLTDFSLDELIAHSALIVEGQILSANSTLEGELVYTTLTLGIDEVLKGDYEQAELPLRFLGGSQDTFKVEVAGQFIPATGERGLFFISDPYAEQVNPLTGWYQGFFREITVPGKAGTFLDLQARPDLILVNLPTDPLLKKLLGLGMSEAQISARFPDYQRFPVQDFKDYVRFQAEQEGL